MEFNEEIHKKEKEIEIIEEKLKESIQLHMKEVEDIKNKHFSELSEKLSTTEETQSLLQNFKGFLKKTMRKTI
jgi:hypothetical protein